MKNQPRGREEEREGERTSEVMNGVNGAKETGKPVLKEAAANGMLSEIKSGLDMVFKADDWTAVMNVDNRKNQDSGLLDDAADGMEEDRGGSQ